MNLIEAARGLQFTPWEDSCNWTCEACGASTTEWGDGEAFPHRQGCPWLRRSSIIAALELAGEAIKAERRRYPDGFLPPDHPLSALALALYGRPTAIVVGTGEALPTDPT